MNDKKKFMEMRKDVTSLLSRISSTRCPLHSTDSPQRVIVLQGPLIKYSRAAILSSMANRYGVLFSDCFVWIKGLPTVVGNAAPSGKGYVSRVVFLKDMTGISDVKNDSKEGINTLLITFLP